MRASAGQHLGFEEPRVPRHENSVKTNSTPVDKLMPLRPITVT